MLNDDGDEYGRLRKFTAYKMHLPLYSSTHTHTFQSEFVTHSFILISVFRFCSLILSSRSTKSTFLAEIVLLEFRFVCMYRACVCVYRTETYNIKFFSSYISKVLHKIEDKK